MADFDSRRTFRRSDVWHAYQRQGQLCPLCKRAIPFDLMHGDHIVPWSYGGLTTLDNCQALCGSCNLRKGVQPQAVIEQFFRVDVLAPAHEPLRRWQQEALSVTLTQILDHPVLVEACPGAGKTRFGLEVAYQLIANGTVSRVLVFVPSLGISDGWIDAASAATRGSPTIPLLGPRNWTPVQPIPSDWAGAIATYQSLFTSTEMFLAHATDPGHRTLVIFDEIHHAGIDSGWGTSAQEAFRESAAAILCLTGTPFRTNRDAIVFVRSDGGRAIPDYRYGYDRALEDGACRPVQFVFARGITTFRTEDNDVHTVSFDDRLTQIGDRRRLRTALELVQRDSIAHLLLADANEYILRLRRRGDSDAGGLVVCVDCQHADRIADFMGSDVIRSRPVVACSRLFDPGDPEPANAIRGFRTSHEPWLIAVNMVSEGVDIRRLRVVVYLTNRLTTLSFRQIVGRVVRIDPHNVDDHGRVYLPADPTLVSMAKEITSEVILLPRPMIIEMDSERARHVRIVDETGLTPVAFEPLGSFGHSGSALDTGGREANARLLELAKRYIDRHSLTGTDPVSLALAASENDKLRAVLEKENG
jgi:superfamily II DNA or RNA helicase